MANKPDRADVTNDLSKFDPILLEDAAVLLKSYMFQQKQATFLGKGVMLYYNPAYEKVYLMDENFNIGMLNNGELTQWVTCRTCGVEGFIDSDEPGFINATSCKACAQKLFPNRNYLPKLYEERLKSAKEKG